MMADHVRKLTANDVAVSDVFPIPVVSSELLHTDRGPPHSTKRTG